MLQVACGAMHGAWKHKHWLRLCRDTLVKTGLHMYLSWCDDHNAHNGSIVVITPAQKHVYSCLDQYIPAEPQRCKHSSQQLQEQIDWAYGIFPSRHVSIQYDLPVASFESDSMLLMSYITTSQHTASPM